MTSVNIVRVVGLHSRSSITLINIMRVVGLHSRSSIAVEEGGLQVVAAITPSAVGANTKSCGLKIDDRKQVEKKKWAFKNAVFDCACIYN